MVIVIIICCFLDTFLFELVSTYFIQVDKIGSGSFGSFTCPFTEGGSVAFYLSVFPLIADVYKRQHIMSSMTPLIGRIL